MTQARNALTLALTLLVSACAAEANLVTGQGEQASLEADSESEDADANDAGSESEAPTLHWTQCVENFALFAQGKTLDTCSFASPCGTTDGCSIATYTCEDGVLWKSTGTAPGCETPAPECHPFPFPGQCVEVTEDPCCIAVSVCGDQERVATVCTQGCDLLEPRPGRATIQSCDELAEVLKRNPGESVAGWPCNGVFACPELGVSSYGDQFWCDGSLVHRAATGPSFLATYLKG